MSDLRSGMDNPEAMFQLLAETGLRMWFKLFSLPSFQKKLSEEDDKNKKKGLTDQQQFIQGIVQGSFKKVIRNNFLLESLRKFCFLNPAIEGVLNPFRKMLIGMENLDHFNETIEVVSAIAIQVYLTDYFWPYETQEEHELKKKIIKLKTVLKQGALKPNGEPLDEFVFYLALISMYTSPRSNSIYLLGEGEEWSLKSVLQKANLKNVSPFFQSLLQCTCLNRLAEEVNIESFK